MDAGGRAMQRAIAENNYIL